MISKLNRTVPNNIVKKKLDWNINKQKDAYSCIDNLETTMDLIIKFLSKETKMDYHKTSILNDNNYVSIDKSGKSGDKLHIFRPKNGEKFIALVKTLVNYQDKKDPQASKIKEAVNSYYMGEKYEDYFPKVYDINAKDDNLYLNMELVDGEEFTKICKMININQMKQILFIILYALVKIKNDKIFFKHYDIHPDNIMVQQVKPYKITFNDKTYLLNYKIKFIDLGRSFVFTDAPEDILSVSKYVIQTFDIEQRRVPLASFKCRKDVLTAKLDMIKYAFSPSNEETYNDIDLYFIKTLFNYIYDVICKRDLCNEKIKESMNEFKMCDSLDSCIKQSFFDDIIETKGGQKLYYNKYIKYKKKYEQLKHKYNITK